MLQTASFSTPCTNEQASTLTLISGSFEPDSSLPLMPSQTLSTTKVACIAFPVVDTNTHTHTHKHAYYRFLSPTVTPDPSPKNQTHVNPYTQMHFHLMHAHDHTISSPVFLLFSRFTFPVGSLFLFLLLFSKALWDDPMVSSRLGVFLDDWRKAYLLHGVLPQIKVCTTTLLPPLLFFAIVDPSSFFGFVN